MNKQELYTQLYKQAQSLTDGTISKLSNMANTAALIYHTLPDVNWAGFYLVNGDVLTLGCFCGKPACTSIRLGRGVCGTAALQRRQINVPDVTAFCGHIACDSASRSEIVTPIILADGTLVAVLDVDSTSLDRFDCNDEQGLLALAPLIAKTCF